MAARKVHEIAIDSRVSDALYAGAYVPTLAGWNDKAADLAAMTDDWKSVADELKASLPGPAWPDAIIAIVPGMVHVGVHRVITQ